VRADLHARGFQPGEVRVAKHSGGRGTVSFFRSPSGPVADGMDSPEGFAQRAEEDRSRHARTGARGRTTRRAGFQTNLALPDSHAVR